MTAMHLTTTGNHRRTGGRVIAAGTRAWEKICTLTQVNARSADRATMAAKGIRWAGLAAAVGRQGTGEQK